MRTHQTLLSEMEAVLASIDGLVNNLGYHNPLTEEKLSDAYETLRAAIHGEKHYEGVDDASYEAERHTMRDVLTVPSYRGVV